MAKRTRDRVVVCSAPKGADILTVVHVDGTGCTLSTGELLLVKWEKLRALCEQVCQERCAVSIRTWMTRDGNELIELHRSGGKSFETATATPLGKGEEAF